MSERKEADPIGSLSSLEGGWLIILAIQGIYLTLDVEEAATEKIAFGFAAAVFMVLLGVLIVAYTIKDLINQKENVAHGLFQGAFYITFAIVIYYFKAKRAKMHRETKTELAEVSTHNEMLRGEIRGIQNR